MVLSKLELMGEKVFKNILGRKRSNVASNYNKNKRCLESYHA